MSSNRNYGSSTGSALPRYDQLGGGASTEFASSELADAPSVSAGKAPPSARYDHFMRSAEDQELEILRLENELRDKQNTLRHMEIHHEKELRRKNSDLDVLYATPTTLELQERYRVLTERHKAEHADKLHIERSLNEKVKNMALSDTQLRRMINDLQNEKTLFLQERHEWEAREREYLAKLHNLKECKKDWEEMYQEKQLSEQARIQMQKIVNDSLNETQKRLSASRNHEDELIHQNAALKAEVLRNARHAAELAVRIDKLEQEKALLSDENLQLREDLRLKGDAEGQRDSVLVQLKKHEEVETTLNTLIHRVQEELKRHSHGHKEKLDEVLKAKLTTD